LYAPAIFPFETYGSSYPLLPVKVKHEANSRQL